MNTEGLRDERVRVKAIRGHQDGNGGVTEVRTDIQLRERKSRGRGEVEEVRKHLRRHKSIKRC